MSHDITDVQETPFSVVLVCVCGHRAQHPKRDGAEQRHEVHVQIEEARANLRGKGPDSPCG